MKRALVAAGLAGLAVTGMTSAPAPADSNAVVNSATGAGHRISGGEFRSFSFSAVRYADGSATGQAQVYPRSLDAYAHIAIDCLKVTGNVAHMSGVVTHTSDPTVFILDEQVHFAVEDNGEGRNSLPDRVTGIPENEPLTCEDALPTAVFNPIVRGNVRVR